MAGGPLNSVTATGSDHVSPKSRDLARTIWRGSKLVQTAYSVPPPVVFGGPDRGSTNSSTRWFILNLPWMDLGTVKVWPQSVDFVNLIAELFDGEPVNSV